MMDMPISQINSRLLAQLPADLGLGLLFATGTVGQIVYASGDRPIQFSLRHEGYSLFCKVAPRVECPFELAEGQQVRATGHLSFSSQSARYHLLVRDLELLDSAKELEPAGDVEVEPNKEPERDEAASGDDWAGWNPNPQTGQATALHLELADIPEWVYALAPPEARPAAGWGERRARAAVEAEQAAANAEEPAADSDGDDELMSFLLAALDRSEDEDVDLSAGATPVARLSAESQAAESDESASSPAAGSSRQILLVSTILLILGLLLILAYLASRLGWL
jgi:hypothetical protein